MYKILLLILGIIIFFSPIVAQKKNQSQINLADSIISAGSITGGIEETVSKPSDEMKESNIKSFGSIELPPLQLLLNNARRSSAIEYYDAKLIEEMAVLKTEKRAWLKYMKLDGSYKYGTTGFSGEGSGDPIFTFSGGTQSLYSFGLSVSIPLEDVFNRGLKNRKQSMRVRETELELDRAYDELKITIIESYAIASKMLSVLNLKGDLLLLTNMSYRDAEKEYKQGKCTLEVLKTMKEQQIAATQDYEDVRLTLNSILLKLEILSRTQIVSK